MGIVIQFEAHRQRLDVGMKSLVEQLAEYEFFRIGHCEHHEYHPSEPEYEWWTEKARQLYRDHPEKLRKPRPNEHYPAGWPVTVEKPMDKPTEKELQREVEKLKRQIDNTPPLSDPEALEWAIGVLEMLAYSEKYSGWMDRLKAMLPPAQICGKSGSEVHNAE